jgi:hypothetical protein
VHVHPQDRTEISSAPQQRRTSASCLLNPGFPRQRHEGRHQWIRRFPHLRPRRAGSGLGSGSRLRFPHADSSTDTLVCPVAGSDRCYTAREGRLSLDAPRQLPYAVDVGAISALLDAYQRPCHTDECENDFAHSKLECSQALTACTSFHKIASDPPDDARLLVCLSAQP